jgi:DNA-binding GntR family transcriptional regulator
MRSRPIPDEFEKHNKISTQEHRQIVEAIINKDVSLAVATLNKHLGRAFGVHVQQSLKQVK